MRASTCALIEAAREAGASEDEADFDRALKRITKANPAPIGTKRTSKKMKAILCSLIAASIVLSTRDARGSTMIGYGAQTCGKWLEDRQKGAASLDEAWILGYLSAWNSSNTGAADGEFRNIDNAGIFAWIDAACGHHPLELIGDAAARLTQYLAKRITR